MPASAGRKLGGVKPDEIRDRVLARYGLTAATCEPFGRGLINTTYLVRADGTRLVLQRVNPIFPAAIHQNLRAVTARLGAAGLTTPQLVPTDQGDPCLDLGADGVWRLMTFVDGVSFDVVQAPAQAHAAGALVARFHRALDGLPHEFVGMRAGVHDTPRHLARLREAVTRHPGHRLFDQVADLASRILAIAAALPGLPPLPERICHGDLKFNNVLFAGADGLAAARAISLIDLDTVGPLPLAYELGDAWRSWCNRSGEDAETAVIDLDVFEASLAGYHAGWERALSQEERTALLLGVEWISLELAARFAADALDEAYFGWDRERFSGRGEHNLVRARGQLSLHEAFVRMRAPRERMLATCG